MSATTTDAFLGDRVTVVQPVAGYRAGADPVFLAAAVPAQPGESVLDIGCGVGVAMLCLAVRVPGVRVTGVERDATMARLAEENLDRNRIEGEVLQVDLAKMPSDLRARSFHHVFANPPFFDRNSGSRAELETREAGRGLETPLDQWTDAAIRRLRPGGTFTLVNRIERLPDCLTSLDARVGDIVVKPLAPRREKPAKLFIMQAKKGARGRFRLAPPLILHSGDRHEGDGDSYTPEAAAILREAASLQPEY